MASDIKLLDEGQVLVEGTDLVVDRGQEQSDVALNLKNPTGFWHISGPRTYEAGNPLSIFWNNNTNFSSPYLTINTAGSVGIGTPTPGYRLDVADRMRVRQAKDTAGIWFYQTKPAKDQAFVGMSTDTQVGVWGNTGAGWGLVMDTTTGNVGIGTGQTTPSSKLQVNGNLTANSINVGDLQAIKSIKIGENKDQPTASVVASSSNINIDNASLVLSTNPGTTDITSGSYSLSITSSKILVRTTSKVLSPGGGKLGGIPVGEVKTTENVLDLVEEVRKLRTEINALKAKVNP